LEKKLEKATNKENKPTRGIETMFRTTSKNHLDLSAMADNKANIMISINSIILSIIVSVLIRKLEEYPHFIIPTLIMTVVCLVTIVLSILATRPNISKGKFTQSDITNKRTNLLFFGNFHKMSLSEYEWGMNELMNDSSYLYGSLIKDIYYLGAVLGKKYKRLRVAYTVFMFGFVVAVLSFIVAEVFFKNQYMY
ncbi:Pycsar system effector family protein, partial [Reichenbachiella sp.]